MLFYRAGYHLLLGIDDRRPDIIGEPLIKRYCSTPTYEASLAHQKPADQTLGKCPEKNYQIKGTAKERKCGYCGSTSTANNAKMRACGGCRINYYCDTECQQKGEKLFKKIKQLFILLRCFY